MPFEPNMPRFRRGVVDQQLRSPLVVLRRPVFCAWLDRTYTLFSRILSCVVIRLLTRRVAAAHAVGKDRQCKILRWQAYGKTTDLGGHGDSRVRSNPVIL